MPNTTQRGDSEEKRRLKCVKLNMWPMPKMHMIPRPGDDEGDWDSDDSVCL